MISEDAQIGLDFGTTTTLLTYTNSDLDATRIVPLSLDTAGRNWLPSLAAYVDGKIVVGPEAEKAESWAKIRSAKRHITLGHEVVTLVDNNGIEINVALDEVIVAILAHVVDVALKQGIDLRHRPVRMGCPSAWSGTQRKKLIECAHLAGMSNVSIDDIRDEPVAAGLQYFDYLRRQGQEYRGNLLVFDMGGGTLDVALLKINARLTGAEVFVLASDGNQYAGDAFDESFAQIIEPKLRKDNEDFVPNEVFSYLASQIIESEKKSLEYTGTARPLLDIRYSDRTSDGTLELNEEELVLALKPIMERAKVLIDKTLREYKLIHEDHSTRGSVSRIPSEVLFEEVDKIFLVGGMTQLRNIRKFLQEFFPNREILSQADLFSSGEINKPEESVGLGLAAFREPDGLNLFRPPFDINLEWKKRNGESSVVTLYPAFEPISTSNLMQDNHFCHAVNLPRELHPEIADAYLVIRTPSGLMVRIQTVTPELVSSDGELVRESETIILNSLKVKLGPSDFRFVFYASGRIVVHDCEGREHELKITEWPAIRSNRRYPSDGPVVKTMAGVGPRNPDGSSGNMRIIPSYDYPHI